MERICSSLCPAWPQHEAQPAWIKPPTMETCEHKAPPGKKLVNDVRYWDVNACRQRGKNRERN